MTDPLDDVFRLIERATETERRAILAHLRKTTPIHTLEVQWGTTAEAILSAIARSSDLTQRGIRGILAEAIFEERVIPVMARAGWRPEKIVGNPAYDFLLRRGAKRVRIQVKLQRREAGIPKIYSQRARLRLRSPPQQLFVVEVQKTRSGELGGRKTRPYRFGDFDILAVSLHPSTGDWGKFVYTVGGWLIPRANDPDLIEIFQPVPAAPDDYWTDDLCDCISQFVRGVANRLYS